MGIESYSTTAANNSASPPNGWPEGMAPSAVNDTGRQMMADIRAWYEQPEWINFGYAHAYAGGTSFTIGGGIDRTATYHVGRRVKAVGALTGTIHGTITAAGYSAPTNTITVSWDAGALQNEAPTIYLHALAANTGIPAVVARSGTKLLFPGISAAPAGWTIDATAAYDQAAIRVRTSASTLAGGSQNFTDALGSGLSTGSYTLTASDIPAHAHTIAHTHNYDKTNASSGVPNTGTQADSVSGAGGTTTNANHTHAMNFTSTATGAESSANSGSTGGGGGHSHTLPSLAVKYFDACVCVKI